ncbi:hypothetical protein MLD52_21440 [Puniceicoccaceae bacterium K14]|nr:hypothetical protein [Puniceicoccaceae bacterium K14]
MTALFHKRKSISYWFTVVSILLSLAKIEAANASENEFFLGLFEKGARAQFELPMSVFLGEGEELISLQASCDCLQLLEEESSTLSFEYFSLNSGVSRLQIAIAFLGEDGREQERVSNCYALVRAKAKPKKSLNRNRLSLEALEKKREKYELFDVRDEKAFLRACIKDSKNLAGGNLKALDKRANAAKKPVLVANEWQITKIKERGSYNILSFQEYVMFGGEIEGSYANVRSVFEVDIQTILREPFFAQSRLLVVGSLHDFAINPPIFSGEVVVEFEANANSIEKMYNYLDTNIGDDVILISAPDSSWYSHILSKVRGASNKQPKLFFVKGGNEALGEGITYVSEERFQRKSKQSYTSTQLTRTGVFVPGTSKRVVGAGCSTCSSR